MTLRDGVAYLVGGVAALFAIVLLYWVWMYVVEGWGPYAMRNILIMLVLTAFTGGLFRAIKRDPVEERLTS